MLKLREEGYTGLPMRTGNDDMTGPGRIGEGVRANERENFPVGRAPGFEQVFDLDCGNHQTDGVSKPELRRRLIFPLLFAACG